MSYWIEISLALFEGFKLSLWVYLLTLVFAMPLGFVLALITEKFPKSKAMILVFTWVMRGTPLLLQLYVTMYALPLIIPMRLDRLSAGAITFILNYSAYYTEIFRSGLSIIPIGQSQAAKVLGMKERQIVWYILLPQMIRNTLLPLINEAITLVKDTALLAAIALAELLRNAKEIVSRDLKVDALFIAALFYLGFSLCVVLIGKQLERRVLRRV